MKKHIKAFALAATLLMLSPLTACNDYLDLIPEDQIVPENFFNTAENLSSYTLPFYGNFITHSSFGPGLGTFSADNGTDNQVAATASFLFTPGEWRTTAGLNNWDFATIREINFFFKYAQKNYDAHKISGAQSEIDQAMGEAHFFRALAYWQRYSLVGDYPIVEGVLPDKLDALLEASRRQPRHLVARYILDDLSKAEQYLPETSSKGKNGLSKDCARLFRSRVALFEGTWLKNHKGTALVPGAPGWPGDPNLLEGFNIDDEIRYFLTEAMVSAKLVADKFAANLVPNTADAEGMAEGFRQVNPYYCMFCVEDPSSFSEVLLFKRYNLQLGQKTNIQSPFQQDAGGTGWTRGMVCSFLMSNGLPIYAQGSGYDPAWENQGVDATLQNRDSRIRIFTKGDNSIRTYGTDGHTPLKYNMGWLLYGQSETKCVTGYAVKKGQGYNFNECTGGNQSVTASIIFRASEALLNYMEAKVERDGQLDPTATSYWQALRTRAHVDADVMKTVNATIMSEEAKYDWGAYTRGKLVAPLLYNVRRERRNELCGEAMRELDLRRWCACDQMIETPYQIEGIKYWGTVYADPQSELCIKSENGAYLAALVSPDDGKGTMSASAESPYVRPYQISRLNNLVWNGLRWTRAHYLYPLGAKVFVDASPDQSVERTVVYQNPGWSMIAGEAPSDF